MSEQQEFTRKLVEALDGRSDGDPRCLARVEWLDSLLDACKTPERFTEAFKEDGSSVLEAIAHCQDLVKMGREALAAVNADAPVPSAKQPTLHASLIEEAANVLGSVGASGVELPSIWRWPLIDELGGIAALVRESPPCAGHAVPLNASGVALTKAQHLEERGYRSMGVAFHRQGTREDIAVVSLSGRVTWHSCDALAAKAARPFDANDVG